MLLPPFYHPDPTNLPEKLKLVVEEMQHRSPGAVKVFRLDQLPAPNPMRPTTCPTCNGKMVVPSPAWAAFNARTDQEQRNPRTWFVANGLMTHYGADLPPHEVKCAECCGRGTVMARRVHAGG